MARRGSSSAAFSLFAFQDIITSVTGIMVLVTMILALDLLEQKEGSPPRKTAQLATQVEAAVAANEARIEELKSRLAQGREKMQQVAALDSNQVRRQLEDLEQLTEDLDSELDKFAKEQADVDRRRDAAEAEKERRASDAGTLDELLAEAERKKEQIEQFRETNRTIFNPAETDAKVPWLVEVTGEGFSAAKWGEAARPKTFDTAAGLGAFAAGQDKAAEYFVLLVKPRGVENFDKARQVLEAAGFDVGFDLISSDQTVLDPEKGAAVE